MNQKHSDSTNLCRSVCFVRVLPPSE